MKSKDGVTIQVVETTDIANTEQRLITAKYYNYNIELRVS